MVCDYLDKTLSGRSPKFACRRGEDDELKVKYGGTNGEVYGEVLATRLLWVLGFGADAMYPVNVICRGCPQEFGGIARPGNEYRFDPARGGAEDAGRGVAVERRQRLVVGGDAAGGAARAAARPGRIATRWRCSP